MRAADERMNVVRANASKPQSEPSFDNIASHRQSEASPDLAKGGCMVHLTT